VQIAGFGTFEVRERAASKAPAFKAGKAFKDMLK
jgi:nucleoid DNA-binding protein